MARQVIALALLALSLGAGVQALPVSGAELFSADGYRIARYRSPTPARAAGAQTVSTADMQALLAETPQPVVIDVIHSTYRAGRFLHSEPHRSLPSAVWLPNTGDGQLDSRWRHYLIDNTLTLTGHNRAHPVAVLCKSDCWLSWNAVQRLAAAGFSKLYWYRDGVDGWAAAGLPLRPVTPLAPRFRSADAND